jgi:hypothetical protein
MATQAITADAVYSSFPAKFDNLLIRDVTDVRPSVNLQKIVAMAGGSVDPGLIAEVSREPAVDLSALDIGLILASVPIETGMVIGTAAKIQYQARSDGGTLDSGSNHITLSTAKGFLHIDSMEARQDDQAGAKLAMKFWALVTGSNAPLIVNISQALTSTPLVSALYKLGPVTFEGSILGGVQSVSVKTGMEYKPFRAGGQYAAGEGFVRKRAPTIEIETTNIAIVNSIGFGIIGITAGTTVGFAKMGVPLVTAAHVLCGLSAGSYEITDAGVSGEGDAMAKITITGAGALLTALASQALA